MDTPSVTTAALLAALTLTACGEQPIDFDYPRDDAVRFNQLQAKGTHNSYHLAPDPFVHPELDYSHSPLGDQLSTHGIRQFELDINVNVFDDRFEVYHILRVDEGTTCFLLCDCLEEMKRWSDHSPGHHPLAIMIELKDGFDEGYAEHFFELLEEEILSVWPIDRLVTPDLVQGDYASLREALSEKGWPTLGELRGRALFFLLDREQHRDFYTHGDTSLAGRLAFVTASADKPYGAVTALDDPIANAAEIDAAAAAGMLIRTRVDTLGEQGAELDQDRLDAALASGAHFLSTDIEELALPGGSPSRCNPVTADEACTAADVENPEFID